MIHMDQLQLEAKLFKGLADTSRLAILEVISDEPMSVSRIVEHTSLTQSNVSMHLSCLLECGLVQRRKDGRNAYYELSGEDVLAVIGAARNILQRHSQALYDCTRYGA